MWLHSWFSRRKKLFGHEPHSCVAGKKPITVKRMKDSNPPTTTTITKHLDVHVAILVDSKQDKNKKWWQTAYLSGISGALSPSWERWSCWRLSQGVCRAKWGMIPVHINHKQHRALQIRSKRSQEESKSWTTLADNARNKQTGSNVLDATPGGRAEAAISAAGGGAWVWEFTGQ